VLNASRHHRKNRQLIRPVLGVGHRCSTPRGITGKIALKTCGDLADIKLCSTPRGITGKIASERSARRSDDLVLNASRHHRKNRKLFHVYLRDGRSAQRLAASPEKSHVPFVPCFSRVCVLNASRHHRKNRIPRSAIRIPIRPVLNASRHHRKNRSP